MPNIEITIFISVILGAAFGFGVASFFRKRVKNLDEDNKRFESIFKSIWNIEKIVLETVDFGQATQKVVNVILTELGYVNHGYEVIVLSLVDQEKKGLRRIAISKTEAAGKFLQATPIPFNDIIIPFSATNNLSIRAINERKMFATPKVSDVLEPALTREWVDNFQKTLGIKTSIVFPIVAKDKILGSLIFSLSKVKEDISQEEWSVLDSFVDAVGIALDNALLFKSLSDTTYQLKISNLKLKELDRLKDEFVSLASHELRTPMSIIKSYVWQLLNGKNEEPLTDHQKQYLTTTYDSVERLIRLVNDMLNASRIESGRITLEKKQIDLGDLLEKEVSQIMPHANELGIKIEYEKPAEKLVVNVDPDKIGQVLINLVGNSLKFTPRDGAIYIKAQKSNDTVRVSVKDTGRGMDPEDISKLFHKFQMVGNAHLTKEKGQGSGLGLYLSKSLVELHDGKIWAESEGKGKGSTFYFTVPTALYSHEANTSLPPQSNLRE